MKYSPSKTLLTFALSSAFVGCSSNNTLVSTLPGTISQFGAITIEDNDVNFSPLVTAAFRSFDSPVSTSEIDADLANRKLSTDTCDVYIGDESLNQATELEQALESSSLISAGEVITFRGPSGSIGEVSIDAQTFYRTIIATTEATSKGLMVDLPGADFPAATAVPIPDIEPFVLTSTITPTGPSNEDFDIDSTFTWEPGNDPAARINFYSNINLASNTSDVDLLVDIDCTLQDDGSFTLPADIQTQLQEHGITQTPMYIGRETVLVHQSEEALTMIIRRSGPLDSWPG